MNSRERRKLAAEQHNSRLDKRKKEDIIYKGVVAVISQATVELGQWTKRRLGYSKLK